MQTKQCTRCKETKELIYFGSHRGRKDGLNNECRICSTKRVQSNSRTESGLISKIYSQQRCSSRQRNHVYPNYTLNELREWVFSQPNFIILYSNWVKSGYNRQLIPSCDRLDDAKPYSFDNLRLCTWRENDLKGKYLNNEKMSVAVIIENIITNDTIRYKSISQASRETGLQRQIIGNACKTNKTVRKMYKCKLAID